MQNVLITGATGGIGVSIVRKFHDAGYNIIASGTNEKKLKNLNKNYDERVECIKCNLANKDEIKELYENVLSRNINIDILINNAGITRDNLFMRMKDDEWYDVINVNLNSNFILTKLIIKSMVKNRWGRVINITSDAAKIGNAGQSNYVASKAAIEGLTRTLANEFASRGITFNCVSPGFIDTAILQTVDKSRLDLMLKRIPAGRAGDSSEIADLVFFLSSEESSYITGQVIHINGGLTM